MKKGDAIAKVVLEIFEAAARDGWCRQRVEFELKEAKMIIDQVYKNKNNIDIRKAK